ncbi:MAG: DUF4142 domain-containing protein [Pseudomonadota bacterium]|nr:DUF4142 domain-containing protein [Pseudomonadota bacterium]
MKRILLTAVAITLLGAACDRRDDGVEEAADAATTTTTQTDTAVPPPATGPQGVEFTYAGDNTPEGLVQRMAMSDMYEIEASRLALERAESAQVREFAQAMIDAHTRTTTEAKAAIQAQNLTVTLPTALDGEHQGMINDLRGASGEEFDQRYLDQQTHAHQEALDELEDHARDGANAAFKARAAKTATTVRQHLERARTLDRAGADGSTTPGAEAAPTPERRL